MTAEEKAKAYDEALERAKIWQEHLYEVNDKDYADELNYIFPELAELENEKIRKELIHLVKKSHEQGGYASHKYEADRMIAWLKKQGQKPTWSEEDEKAINDIMWIIEAYRENGFNETHKQMANNAEKWLKSLKQGYGWKPSKEQMDAMQMAVSYFDCSWISKEQKLLESLYKDLKKL